MPAASRCISCAIRLHTGALLHHLRLCAIVMTARVIGIAMITMTVVMTGIAVIVAEAGAMGVVMSKAMTTDVDMGAVMAVMMID